MFLRELEQGPEAALAALSFLAAKLSHDLRSPLGTAMAVLQDHRAGHALAPSDYEDAIESLHSILAVLNVLRDMALPGVPGSAGVSPALNKTFPDNDQKPAGAAELLDALAVQGISACWNAPFAELEWFSAQPFICRALLLILRVWQARAQQSGCSACAILEAAREGTDTIIRIRAGIALAASPAPRPDSRTLLQCAVLERGVHWLPLFYAALSIQAAGGSCELDEAAQCLSIRIPSQA